MAFIYKQLFSFEHVQKYLHQNKKTSGVFNVLIATKFEFKDKMWIPEKNMCIGQVTLTTSVNENTKVKIENNKITKSVIILKGDESIIYEPVFDEFLGLNKGLFYIGYNDYIEENFNDMKKNDHLQDLHLTIYLEENNNLFNNVNRYLPNFINAQPKGGKRRSTKKSNKKGTKLKKCKSIRVKGRRK